MNRLNNFSKWKKWDNKRTLKNLEFPGIYVIAKSSRNIENIQFDFISEIIYIGMTNSKSGLKNRLKQFEDTLDKKRENHGGAQRVRFKYPNSVRLKKYLYTSINYFSCDPASNKVKDLLTMGKVAEFEYVCFAEYTKRFNRLPKFNDQKQSPKK